MIDDVPISSEMSAFDEEVSAIALMELPRGCGKFGFRANSEIKEKLRFGEIRRYERCQGEKGLFECQNSVIVQEGGAAAGANHRIDHERNVAVFSEKTDYSLHQRRLRKHPCFCRADGKGGLNSVELVTQEGWIDGLKRSDLTRNLCNDRGDRAETVDSVRSKSFQIRLDPGTGRGIGPGDGESEGRSCRESFDREMVVAGIRPCQRAGLSANRRVKSKAPYLKSIFANNLTEHSGITELMDDLGEALALGKGQVRMMGGGSPAHIPAMQAIWRARMKELLFETPDEYDRIMADYDQPAGNPAFREALASFLNREYGWELSAKNIAITSGGQTAFFFLLNRFAGKMVDGTVRKILLPLVPEYIGYGDQAVSEHVMFDGRRPKIELIGERSFKYHIDFDSLDLNESHGAIAVSRPTNPSSNVLTDEEIGKLRQLAAAAGIPLIIDNAYGLPFPGVIFHDATPVWDENIILTLSLSKLGLPGTRTGIVVAREEIISEIRSMTAIIGLSNNNIGQAMARPIIESGEVLCLAQEVVMPYYRERSERSLALAHQHLPPEVPWRIHESEGAFFLWFWFDRLPISCRELYRRLKDANLIIVPGEYFFYGLDTSDWDHARQCIRVSFTQPEEIVADGFRILGEVIREVYAI